MRLLACLSVLVLVTLPGCSGCVRCEDGFEIGLDLPETAARVSVNVCLDDICFDESELSLEKSSDCGLELCIDRDTMTVKNARPIDLDEESRISVVVVDTVFRVELIRAEGGFHRIQRRRQCGGSCRIGVAAF